MVCPCQKQFLTKRNLLVLLLLVPASHPLFSIFQACRGTKFDWGADVADSDHIDAGPEDDNLRKIPIEADVLMAYSVVPGQ